MGREIRRVPLDFDWPTGKLWDGFVNPHYKECGVCKDNRGYSETYLELDAFTHILLIAAQGSSERPDDYVPTKVGPRSQSYRMFGSPPTEEQTKQWPFDTDPVEVLASIAGEEPSPEIAWSIRRLARLNKHPGMYSPQMAEYQWSFDEEGNRVRKTVLSPYGMVYYPHPYLVEDYGIADIGPDFCSFIKKLGCTEGFMGWEGDWSLQKAILTHQGYVMEGCDLPDELLCPICKGTSVHPDHQEEYENWEPHNPPTGDGYQLWDTTSEGYPMSPVSSTPEELATWLYENEVSSFGSQTSSYETWLNFIQGPGWGPSFVGSAKGLQNGVDYVAGSEK